jgi:hypothetical protein
LSDLNESVSHSAREATKNAMVWGLDVAEGIQSTFAEAQESFNDLLAEAKEARQTARTEIQVNSKPQSIDITSD